MSGDLAPLMYQPSHQTFISPSHMQPYGPCFFKSILRTLGFEEFTTFSMQLT